MSGLRAKRPGKAWVSMSDLVPGSHLSVSVSKARLQANLNNEFDLDRATLDALYADRAAIQGELSASLLWQKKDGKKKTAIRDELAASFEDRSDWERQFSWAVERMLAFERTFAPRLAALKS